jgi:hypothetical protein
MTLLLNLVIFVQFKRKKEKEGISRGTIIRARKTPASASQQRNRLIINKLRGLIILLMGFVSQESERSELEYRPILSRLNHQEVGL